MARREQDYGPRRGDGRDPYTDDKERARRGGGRYDAGPGDEGLPGASDMDRPAGRCGTFERTGDSRESINKGIRSIQDADER